MYTLPFFFAKKDQKEGTDHAASLNELGTTILDKYVKFHQHARANKKHNENKVCRK